MFIAEKRGNMFLTLTKLRTQIYLFIQGKWVCSRDPDINGRLHLSEITKFDVSQHLWGLFVLTGFSYELRSNITNLRFCVEWFVFLLKEYLTIRDSRSMPLSMFSCYWNTYKGAYWLGKASEIITLGINLFSLILMNVFADTFVNLN